MALEGNLKDFSPFHIMELITFKKRTGLLFVTSLENETITLGFEKKGLVLAQTSNKESEMQLGNILVQLRNLSEAKRDKALGLQKGTLDRLGYILRREKYCTEKDICEGIHFQIKRIFFNLLHWKEGIYIFEPRDSIDYFHEFVKPVFVEALDVKRLMMEGAVMIDEWPKIEKAVGSLDKIYRYSSGFPGIRIKTEADEFDFEGGETTTDDGVMVSEEEESIFRLIDGHRSIAGILDQTLYSEFLTYKAISELLSKGLIEEGIDRAAENNKDIEAHIDIDEISQNEIAEDNWEAARILIQRALPEAMILEMKISEKKATRLQGDCDPTLWPGPIFSIFNKVLPLENGSQIGVFEAVASKVGVAFFWDHRSDYMLVVFSPLVGDRAASRFRAHVATITRCILV